jgi:hypothetical protein
MILLWGLPGDEPLRAVHEALRRIGAPVVLLDQRAVLDTDVEVRVGSHVEGILRTETCWVDLSTVTAFYLRPYDSRRLPAIASAGRNSREWCHALAVEDILMSWAELTSSLVVNRPGAMAANNSKPYQAMLIEKTGFSVPDCLVTTDPTAVSDFCKRHRVVIYKSVSGTRSKVSRLTIDHLSRLEDVTWCPTQFQQYIPGDDYRVHVVGDQIFACRIRSEADDYRYASTSDAVSISPFELPADVITRCKTLSSAMSLIVAGLDLRRCREGNWYCFEVNPSPGFTYFQASSGQPIDDAIARLLTQ